MFTSLNVILLFTIYYTVYVVNMILSPKEFLFYFTNNFSNCIKCLLLWFKISCSKTFMFDV